MPSHIHKQVSLSTAVRGCEQETGNEKYIDFSIDSADIIIADEPPTQMLLALISADITGSIIIHY